MRDEIRKLRARLAGREFGPGKRYPPEIRQRITEIGKRRYEEGASWREIAEELGVPSTAVQRLCARAGAGFAAVEVVDEAGMVAVVTPSGCRVEGLTLAAAADLLRKLA